MTLQANSAPKIPQLWIPLPSAIHPSWHELDEHASAWLDKFGLYNDEAQRGRLVRIGVGELTARGTPRGLLPQLHWAADFLMWLFAFDDAYCDEGATADSPDETVLVMTRLQRVVEAPWSAAPASAEDQYAAALRDIRLRLDGLATPVQTARWVNTVRAYLQGQVWLAANRAHGRVPSISDYVMVRIDSGAVKTAAAQHDIIDGFELPSADYEHPDVRALIEVFCSLIDWANDLVSYHKERQRGGDRQNLVDVIAHERKCSRDDAVAEAKVMQEQAMVLYLQLRDQIRRTAGPELHRWLDDCDSWIRADHDWSLTTDRYLNPEDPADLPATVDAMPREAASAQPLPIDSIAWWWTRLKGKPSS